LCVALLSTPTHPFFCKGFSFAKWHFVFNFDLGQSLILRFLFFEDLGNCKSYAELGADFDIFMHTAFTLVSSTGLHPKRNDVTIKAILLHMKLCWWWFGFVSLWGTRFGVVFFENALVQKVFFGLIYLTIVARVEAH
jgi:hypothetical protein